MRSRPIHALPLVATLLAPADLLAQRVMERLDRGVVATRVNATSAFVSWRSLALDTSALSFNLYRSTAGGTATKVNATPITGGTNWSDAGADLSKANAWFVRPVLAGQELTASGSYTLSANADQEPVLRIPLKSSSPLSGFAIKWCWVGDLDGDGEYDFVLDRLAAGQQQYLEAYKRDGTMLWRAGLGASSIDPDNIEPGAGAIDVGHWDGVTVYDFDSDGKAEVAIRGASGITFGDGTQWTYSDAAAGFVFMLDGMTGKQKAWIKLPTDFASAGPLAARFGVGYLDGVHPSLIGYMKNRNDDKSFNLMECAWSFDGSKLVQQWKYKRDASGGADGHNTRIADVDEDGKDEVCEIGFCLKPDGTIKYVLPIDHGDRWYIGKLDPDRPGLQGYGIQQEASTGLLAYYYDAAKGTILWKHAVAAESTFDVGRGDVGDMDPRYRGYEVWSFAEGRTIWNGPKNTQTSTAAAPWPSLRLWWDGDLLSEQVNETKFEKWNYESQSVVRLMTTYKNGASMGVSNWPAFVGDILGDWREEVVYVNGSYDSLLVFTTQTPTANRIYALAQNPAYRSCLTLKGYNQSHLADFYLGDGMATPPKPNIALAGASVNHAPVATSAKSFSIPENTTAVGQYKATDSDNDAVTWAIAGGDDSSRFALDRTTGQLTLRTAPDFEKPVDVGTDNIYKVAVSVCDGKTCSIQSISVLVTDVSEAVSTDRHAGGSVRTRIRWLDLRGEVVAVDEQWLDPSNPRPRTPKSVRGLHFAQLRFDDGAPRLLRILAAAP